ncbi:MAG: serine hydrolase domain-containing protein, partial [Actinomycetota bacterium]
MTTPATVADSLTAGLAAHLDGVTRRRRRLGPPQVLVRTPEYEFSHGPRETPFHGASIGKAATAVLVMQLVDDGVISLGSHATDLLPAGTLDGLYVVDGVDRASEVTVEQLLTHTSGVGDYFEGRTTAGPRVTELIIREPDRFWEPADLLEFTRTRQRPVGRPGERFSYSDTGYILLGLLLEHVTGRAFHDLLHERIFRPLGMADSYLMFRSEPDSGARPLAPLRL